LPEQRLRPIHECNRPSTDKPPLLGFTYDGERNDVPRGLARLPSKNARQTVCLETNDRLVAAIAHGLADTKELASYASLRGYVLSKVSKYWKSAPFHQLRLSHLPI
jgi:hypothetical protein